VSPFAQVQKAAKARNAIQVGNAAMGLKELFPDIGDNISGDNLIRTVADGLSGDPSLIVDPRQVQQRRQVRAQQAQPDVELRARRKRRRSSPTSRTPAGDDAVDDAEARRREA
jgi:hypothetical protein